MARSAYLPMPADRYEPCVRTIIFRGVDLRGSNLHAQIRQNPENPVLLVDLPSVTGPDAQGLRLADFQIVDGKPISTVEFVVGEQTMAGLPYASQLGQVSALAYDMQATIHGRKRKLVGGPFSVIPGVTGADGAPAKRQGGAWHPSSDGTWTSATLTFSDDKAEVSLAGLDLFDDVAAILIANGEEERATTASRALLYGIQDPAAARLMTGTSIEAAFSEGYYRNLYRKADGPAGLPGWQYSRAGGPASAPTTSGLLPIFAANAPRITDEGLRIEPPSTNNARPGNDFSNALWTKTGVALSAGGTGPFGAMTRVTATSAGFHFVGQVVDNVSTLSCYVRVGSGIRRVGLQIQSGATTRKVVFDLVSVGVISVDAGVTAWIDPGPLGTYRIIATVAQVSSATIRIHALDDAGADAWPTDGTKSFELSAVQAEPSAIVTSYIDTATLAAQRGLDIAKFDFSPSGAFTIFAEVALRRSEGLENTLFSLIGTSPDDRVALVRTSAGRLAIDVVNGGILSRGLGPTQGAGRIRCALTYGAGKFALAVDGTTIVPFTGTRPSTLKTLWLGIRGTVEAALNGSIGSLLAIPRLLTTEELIGMTSPPRSLTAVTEGGVDTDAVREMLIAHANDRQVHGLTATNRLAAEADSKTGIWTVAATDTFTGTEGSTISTTETGGLTWVNPGNFQRVGGRAKQPANAFGGAAIDTTFTDGQIEADLYPGTGEASLVFRSNTNFNQYFLLQRGGDGTVRLAYVFTATELLRPLISLPVVAGERWKVRFVGPRIFVYRIVSGVETLIYEASDTRLATNVRHGLRLNGTGTVDNFRLLKREAL